MLNHKAYAFWSFFIPFFGAGVSAPLHIAVLHEGYTVTSRAAHKSFMRWQEKQIHVKKLKGEKKDGIVWQKETFA